MEGPTTVQEGEDDEQSLESVDQSVGASTATSGTEGEGTPTAFLTDLHCRVKMSGGFVCGRVAAVCNRRGHQRKQVDPSQTGPKGYYDAREKDPRDGILDTF